MDTGGITRRGFVGAAAGAMSGVAPGVGRAAGPGPGRGPSKVMVIRHAEKPDPDGAPPFGVGPDGRPDGHALLPRGWERAGALARFFVPRDGAPMPPGLARPTFLVAAAPTPEHRSRRSVLTLSPLAELAGLPVASDFGPDHEAEAASAIMARDGVGLVAWEHKRIADLVSAVTGGGVAAPRWPGHRYDVVLVLDRVAPDRGSAGWRLTQVPQLLLADDSAEPLPKDDRTEAVEAARRGHGGVTPPR